MNHVADAPVLPHPKDPAVIGYPVMAALFVFAAALSVGVSLPAALLIMPLTGLAAWTNSRVLDEGGRLSAYAGILAAKLLLLAYQVRFRNVPLSGSDWTHYHEGAAELSASSNGSMGLILSADHVDLFTRLTAVVYSLFGTSSQQIYFLVFITSLAAFSYVYAAAFLFFQDQTAAQRVALLFMVWPNQVVLSVTFLREMPIQMLVAASAYHFLKFWRDHRWGQGLLALALCVAATLMHSGLIVLTIGLAYLMVRDRDRRGLQVMRTVIFAAATVVLLSSPIAEPLLAKFGDLSNASVVLDSGEAIGSEEAEATTLYLNPGLGASPWIQTPYRFVMFTLSPLPWQATSLGTAVAVLVEGLPRLVLVWLLLNCYRRCRSGDAGKDILLLGLLASLIASYLVFSLGVSTYGTAIRHRAKFFPLEIILAYAAFMAGPSHTVRQGRLSGSVRGFAISRSTNGAP